MNTAELAIKIIKKEDPNINTEWLVDLSQDYESCEVSEQGCYEMVKGFVRGLMAVNVIGIEVLCDIDDVYLPWKEKNEEY